MSVNVLCEAAKLGFNYQLNSFKMEKKFNYRAQFGVIVICADEKEQEAVYERLRKEGLTLKIVCV